MIMKCSGVWIGIFCMVVRAQQTVQTSSSSRWLSFPSAKDHHHQLRAEGKAGVTSLREVEHDHEEFFLTHQEALGLHPNHEMVFISQRQYPTSTLVHRTYEQRVDGVRVFGGEFKITLSSAVAHHHTSKDSVLSVHGSPLTESMIDASHSSIDTNNILQAPPRHGEVVRALLKYLPNSRIINHDIDVDVLDVRLSRANPVEIVWYMMHSKAYLAYYIKGIIEKHEAISFYAFVDAMSHSVLNFVRYNDNEHLNMGNLASHSSEFSLKTTLPPSPFSSPISDANIYCYDQFWKDYNDDQDDYYYYYDDPDRFSNDTLAFDTISGSYIYPTDDAELNMLVDNTLYSKYLYYSLSGGTYLTWRKDDGDLNIEYNLTLANAYFDAEWGIHFGTGFITDDVIAHEWSHGYTQTGNDLVYERQSGAMNEGFSDVFGESIDILNEDTADSMILRSSPAQCTSTMNPRYGYGPSRGMDSGHRWCIAEEVSYFDWDNGDGTFRDMYRPECFFHPGAVYSPYYSCTTYYDNGGVHLNSGVFNHLYAVLVDGGEFVNGGATINILPLGLTKTINLYWRVHEELTSTSTFSDFAIAINEICSVNVDEVLYYPNVFNGTIHEVDGWSAADCDTVRNAVTATGMDSADSTCPNIDCSTNRCEWARCPVAPTRNFEVFYEDYDYYMGDYRRRGTTGNIDPACSNTTTSYYARVFDQDYFHLDHFTLSCIQFGYIMLGQTSVKIEVYIDIDGGEPNLDSMVLLASKDVVTVNANNHMQVQTVSFDDPVVLSFNTTTQTLVVMMTTDVMTEGYIAGGGQVNADINIAGEPVGQTFVGGHCLPELISSNSTVQWYIRLQGSSTYVVNSSSGESYDPLQIIAIIVAASVITAVVIGFSYYIMTKNKRKLRSRHVKLTSHDDIRSPESDKL